MIRNISIIHPSRSRPQMAFDTAQKWLERADNELEYIVVIDEDDPEVGKYSELFATLPVTVMTQTNPRHTCIDAINHGAKKAEGDLFVVVSDDFSAPEGWDTLLQEALQDKEDFCLKTTDNYQPFIITLPILDRTYYNRFGYIYHPAYLHQFCDTEMSAVAWLLGKYIQADIVFPHLHYSIGVEKGGMVKDAINEKADATWSQGKAVFKERYFNNFGITSVQELPEYSGLVKYMKTA